MNSTDNKPQRAPRARNVEMERSFDSQASLVRSTCESDVPLIFDGGANLGQSTARYLSRFFECQIHAFEPYPQSFYTFKERFSKEPRVLPHPFALGGSNGKARLHLNSFHGTHSFFPRPSEGRRYYPKDAGAAGEITVEAVRLDDWFTDMFPEGKTIDLLKLDIQGGERQALDGAKRLLGRGQVRLIFCEVFFIAHYEDAPFYHHIAGDLQELNYSLYDFFNLERAENGQLRFADALFIHNEVRHKAIDHAPLEP